LLLANTLRPLAAPRARTPTEKAATFSQTCYSERSRDHRRTRSTAPKSYTPPNSRSNLETCPNLTSVWDFATPRTTAKRRLARGRLCARCDADGCRWSNVSNVNRFGRRRAQRRRWRETPRRRGCFSSRTISDLLLLLRLLLRSCCRYVFATFI